MTNNCEKYNTTQGTWQAYSGSECFSGLSGYDVANQGQAGGKVPTYDTSSHSLNKNESGALIYSSGAKGGTTSSQNGSSASIYGVRLRHFRLIHEKLLLVLKLLREYLQNHLFRLKFYNLRLK